MESAVARLEEQAREARTTVSVLGATEDLDPGEAQRLLSHPLPHWVERMTVSYLKAHGGKAERRGERWNLTWPDGETYENVVFTGKEAARFPAARHLTLEEPKVRRFTLIGKAPFRSLSSKRCGAPPRNTEGPSTRRSSRSIERGLPANVKKPTTPLLPGVEAWSGSVCPRFATIG